MVNARGAHASKRKDPDRPLRALFWMTLSAIGFSLMAVFVKSLAPVVPHFQLVFFRSFINLAIVLPWILLAREPIIPARKQDTVLLVLRGLAGFAGLTCLFYTVTHLPLSISMLLGWTSPIFVILFSRLFLGERLSTAQLAGIGAALGGMTLLVLKLNAEPGVGLSATLVLPLTPFLIGLAGAAFAGLAYVAVRAATARIGVNTIIFYFVGVSTALSAPLAWRDATLPPREIALQLLAMGLAATFAQFTMTQGFRYAAAGLVSAMSLLNAVFSAAFGWGLFGERLSFIQWLGLWTVVLSVAFLALRSYSRRKGVRDGREPELPTG